MDVSHLLYNVFGEHPNHPGLGKTKKIPENERPTLEQYVPNIKSWISNKLSSFEDEDNCETQDGRLGPDVVALMTASHNVFTNQMTLSKDHLTAEAVSMFSTCKANCCVVRGKWMYEVLLRTKGVMQIGWCSADCIFSDDVGVGDTHQSYSYDGSKKRIWHVTTHKYGPFWRTGDIIGCCIDMDQQTIEYYRNGIPLGEAFKDVCKGYGLALFPGISLGQGESLTINFGGSPFRYPIAGYEVLQKKPNQLLEKADFLLQNLANLSRIITNFNPNGCKSNSKKNKLSGSKMPSIMTLYSILAEILIDELLPLLENSYVLEDKLYTYIRGMCVLKSDVDKGVVIHPGMPNSTLCTFLSLLWTGLDGNMAAVLNQLMDFLLSTFNETPVRLDYEKQRIVIVVLSCLCNHSKTRHFFLENKFFKKNALASFLYIKPPDEDTLAKLLPDEKVWTRGAGGSKTDYFDACKKLSQCISGLHALQVNLLKCLLDNEDIGVEIASSRKVFVRNFRRYVKDNCKDDRIERFLRNVQPASKIPAASALSLVCILLEIIKTLFEENRSITRQFVDPKFFYNGYLKYFMYDRVGGVLSHLHKTFRAELVAALGVEFDDNVLAQDSDIEALRVFSSADLNNIYMAMVLMRGNSSSNASMVDANNAISQITGRNRHAVIPPGGADDYGSICELLDCCIMLYYGVAHKHVIMISDLRDNIENLSMTLDAMQESLSKIEKHNDDYIQQKLNEELCYRRDVFTKNLVELARKQAWYRGVALNEKNRDLLIWMLNSVFRTLNVASSQGNLFSFVPEIYLTILPILSETIFDYSHHEVMLQYNLDYCRETLQLSAEFVGRHSDDPRIIIASCKDAMLLTLGALLSHQDGIHVLEKASPSSQMSMLRGLVRVYDKQAWGQNNWLLLRFWKGHGFASRETRSISTWLSNDSPSMLGLCRSRGNSINFTGMLHSVAPAYPSQHYQSLIGRYLMDDEPRCTSVVNSILTQLNWSFTEFLFLLQEIQNKVMGNSLGALRVSKIRVCSLCYELTVSLLQTIEMFVNIAPGIFKDTQRANSDVLLGRVCQVVSQILSRVTVPPGCFQFVVDLCLPDLAVINHVGIISVACGILIGLLEDEMEQDIENVSTQSRVSKMLLNDPSFHIAHIEFIIGDVKTPIVNSDEIPRGNFDPQIRRPAASVLSSNNELPAAAVLNNTAVVNFKLSDYATHVNDIEISKVQKMVKYLQRRQTLMSVVVLPSDDSLCYICCCKAISVEFEPCHHQSCSACINHHLMSNDKCFYCQRCITKILNICDGTVIFERACSTQASPILGDGTLTTDMDDLDLL